MWWENDLLKRISKLAEQTVASQTEWHTMNHWIFQSELPIFPCTVVSVHLKGQIKGPIGVKISKSDSGGEDLRSCRGQNFKEQLRASLEAL